MDGSEKPVLSLITVKENNRRWALAIACFIAYPDESQAKAEGKRYKNQNGYL
jgi:hypothetical protein